MLSAQRGDGSRTQRTRLRVVAAERGIGSFTNFVKHLDRYLAIRLPFTIAEGFGSNCAASRKAAIGTELTARPRAVCGPCGPFAGFVRTSRYGSLDHAIYRRIPQSALNAAKLLVVGQEGERSPPKHRRHSYDVQLEEGRYSGKLTPGPSFAKQWLYPHTL